MERGFIGLNVAVLAIGDAVSVADEPPARLIVDRVEAEGHRVLAQRVLADDRRQIGDALQAWIDDAEIDVVVVTAGVRAEHAVPALEPLATRWLDGFRDLFRYLTYEEIGSAAMLVDAEAALCASTLVFIVPSSVGAVRTALDKLLVPQLDYRTRPRNAVMMLPRVAHADPEDKGAVEPPAPWITIKPATPARPQNPFAKKEITDVGPPPPPPPRGKGGTEKPSTTLKPPARPAQPPRPAPAASTPPPAAAPMKPVVIAGPEVPPEALLPELTADAVSELSPEPRPELAALFENARPKPPVEAPVEEDKSFVVEDVLAAPKPRRPRPETTQTPDSVVRSVAVRDPEPRSTLVIPRQGSNLKVYLVTSLFALGAVAAVLVVYLIVRDRNDARAATSQERDKVADLAPLAPTPETEPTPDEEADPVADEPTPTPVDHTPAAPSEIDMAATLPAPEPGTAPMPAAAPVTPPNLAMPATPSPATPPPSTPPPSTPPTHTSRDHKPRSTSTPSEPTTPAPTTEPTVTAADLEKAPKNAKTDGCDEVSCILDRYEKPCCLKYKPAEPPPAEQPEPPKPVSTSGLPPKLDKEMIQTGIARMKPAVVACGEQYALRGTVSLRVEVAPSGVVTNVSVRGTPSDELGACVAAAIRKATFEKTDEGASFGYPFVF